MNIPESKLAKILLTPASFFYGLAAATKLSLYDKDVISSFKSDIPVISIGNITVGGTGKTPVTIDLANRLLDNNLKVAILSRGYKRQTSEPYTVVSDGTKLLCDCSAAGDEPYLMAQSCPGAVVISGADRSKTAQIARDQFNCDIILLDDGFQHLKLKRDRNLVLIDYSDRLWEEQPIPAGRLREPLSGLRRAQDFVITKVPDNKSIETIEKIKNCIREYVPDARFYSCRFDRSHLKSNFETLPIEAIKDKRVVTVSAIARPESFINGVKELDCTVTATMNFSDHHWFSENDLAKISETIKSSNADFLITTEKDLVRLNLPENLNRITYAVVLKTNWLEEVPELIQESLKAKVSQNNLDNGG